MRAVNRSSHSAATLQTFKDLFDDLQIVVDGNWTDCVDRVTFNSTAFGMNRGRPTLFVEGLEPLRR